MIFQSILDCASRLVTVRAVAILASGGNAKNLGEEMRHFFGGEINRTEAFDARRVDDITAVGKFVHFGERRRVHTRVMRLRHFRRASLRARQQFDKPSVLKRLAKEHAVYVQKLRTTEE